MNSEGWLNQFITDFTKSILMSTVILSEFIGFDDMSIHL